MLAILSTISLETTLLTILNTEKQFIRKFSYNRSAFLPKSIPCDFLLLKNMPPLSYDRISPLPLIANTPQIVNISPQKRENTNFDQILEHRGGREKNDLNSFVKQYLDSEEEDTFPTSLYYSLTDIITELQEHQNDFITISLNSCLCSYFAVA